MCVKIVKMQASGNDYIYLDRTGERSAPLVALSADWIKRACDRHFGIGADGVVVITQEDGYRMYMYNADGSVGRICGNALRSIAYLLDVRHRVAFPLTINTDAGKVHVDRVVDHGKTRYSVEMGVAKLIGIVDRESLYPFYMVDVGNRHAVCLADAGMLSSVTDRARIVGGYDGLNVETYQMIGKQTLSMQVCEYGTGRTLACGSGACAVAYAACSIGICTYGLPINMRMEGGVVDVICHKDGTVRLIGDAHIVFEGEYVD